MAGKWKCLLIVRKDQRKKREKQTGNKWLGMPVKPERRRRIQMCVVSRNEDYGYPVGAAAIGQSSSVMLDQKIQTMTTESRVKSVSNSEPSILPEVPLQM